MASALVVGGAWVLRVAIMVGWGGMGVGDGVRPPTMGHRHDPGVGYGGGVAQGWAKGPPRTLHARRGGTLSRAVFTQTLALNLKLSRYFPLSHALSHPVVFIWQFVLLLVFVGF